MHQFIRTLLGTLLHLIKKPGERGWPGSGGNEIQTEPPPGGTKGFQPIWGNNLATRCVCGLVCRLRRSICKSEGVPQVRPTPLRPRETREIQR